MVSFVAGKITLRRCRVLLSTRAIPKYDEIKVHLNYRLLKAQKRGLPTLAAN